MGRQRRTMKRKASEMAPTPLPGTEGLTGRNEARLILWATRSRIHGAGGWWLAAPAIATASYGAWATLPLGAGTAVATFVGVVLTFLAAAPIYIAAVLLITNAYRRRRGWLVGYFTPDATQLVHPNRSGAWILSDHFARRQGRGLAAAFRRQVFAHLVAEADRHHAVILMETHSEKLAHIYAQDMPRLCVVGRRRHWVNGSTWSLRRDPHPACS